VAEGGWSRGGRQRRWNFNDVGYGRWKRERGGNGVRPFSEEKRGTKRGSSTVPEEDAIAKSGVVTGEVKGGDWRLEVEDY
jgi:hypothetical protein